MRWNKRMDCETALFGYDGINETVALESMKSLFPLFEAYIERMRQWLKELI